MPLLCCYLRIMVVLWEDRRQKRNPKEDTCPHYSDIVMRVDIKMPLHNE